MNRSGSALFLLAMLAGDFPILAAGPEAGSVERIVGIEVVGSQTVSPDTISHYLGVKVGDPYDPEMLRSNFPTLWDVGLLENLRIEAERSPAGVTLIVTVEERPTIKEVQFTGNRKLTTSQMRDRLKEAKSEVKAGQPLSLRDIARARSALADFCLEQGFRGATVEYRIEDVSKTEKKVVFAIDEGDKIKIAAIEFEGNAVLSDRRLRAAMKKTKVDTWWRVFSDKTVYSQASYDADIEAVKALYQSKGYKDVVVKDPALDVSVKNPRAEPKKTKRRARITIPVVEGEQFFTGAFRMVRVERSGQPAEDPDPKVFPKDRLLKAFEELPRGSVLNRELIVGALSRIETLYKSRGYIYWFADPTYREAGDHVVDVDVKLFEGDPYSLGRLETQGNTVTRDKVIRREFALDEGEVMNMEAIKKSLLKLQQLGYFKISEEPDFSVRQEERKVDITVKGTEASKNEIQFGAGYSELDGFFGSFALQNRNFQGRGEIFSAQAQIGATTDTYSLSYTIPWFLDRNQSVGTSLFNNRYDYSNLDETRAGGSVFYGKGLGLFSSWSVLYAYEDIEALYAVSEAPTPPGQPVPPTKFTEVVAKTSSITPSYRFDTRNDPFDPNRGFSLRASVQFADPVIGGTSSFVKPLASAARYFPVRWPRNTYLAANLEAGYLSGLSDSDSALLERFQLGGEQSIRGYQTGSILPLDQNDRIFTDSAGRRLGGNKYFVLNLEYVFAQVGPAKLLAFLDVGNTYHESQTWDLTRVRSSLGGELRIFLPIFQAPLRFIYYFNPNPPSPIDQFGFPIDSLKPRKSGFTFSIGRTF